MCLQVVAVSAGAEGGEGGVMEAGGAEGGDLMAEAGEGEAGSEVDVTAAGEEAGEGVAALGLPQARRRPSMIDHSAWIVAAAA